MILLVILVILAALVLFAVWPGAKREDLRAPFYGRNYAHRGYFGKDQRPPENSLPAFAAAARHGYGIELDVQFTSDHKLVVFHDDTLDRMTPGKGFVHDAAWAEFSAMPLAGSDDHPPLFADMLRTVAEANPATPLIVEIKSRHEYTKPYLEDLCRATLAALKAYPAPTASRASTPAWWASSATRRPACCAVSCPTVTAATAMTAPIPSRRMCCPTALATFWAGRILLPGAPISATGLSAWPTPWARCR